MDANSFVDLKPNPNIPEFRPGDTVRVSSRIIEGERERTQAFEGVVIRIRRAGPASAFTVRRVSHGVGIERVFPYYSPLIEKVQVMRVGRVRRAKLYYLRERIGKAARIRAGSRARFEALTARQAAPPEIEEEIEEELAGGDETLAATEEVAQADAQEEAPEAEAAEAEESPAEEPAEQASSEEPEPELVAEGPDTAEAQAEEAPGEAAAEEPEGEAAEPEPESEETTA